MKDVIMEEVWKRRRQMLRECGGMEGLLQEVARLEAERLEAEKLGRKKLKKRKAASRLNTKSPESVRVRRSRTATELGRGSNRAV